MRALQLLDNRTVAVTDLPDPPPPGEGEVQVRIGAVALNHIDVWGWRGMAFAKRKLPIVVGVEAAGTVDAVGAGVTDLKKGDTVAIFGAETCGRCASCLAGRDNFCENVQGIRGFHVDGLARERLNIAARLAVKAPAGVSIVEAGGSGIGTAAIQLAKAVGAIVITTVGSPDKIEKAKALGADFVINYREERFEGVVRKITRKKGVDVVFEHVGPDTFQQSMFCMKRGGVLVTCGSTTGVSSEINLFALYQQQLRLLGSFGCNIRNLRNSLGKMASGVARPVIDSTIALDDIDAALARIESRQVFGKIIVTL
jgi:alcohol dehydrogenase